MCGRYFLNDKAAAGTLELINAINRHVPVEDIWHERDIRPMENAPVVACNRQRIPSVFTMRWGYTNPDGRVLINARIETASDKPAFAEGMRIRRCAIPYCGYYEWRRVGRERMKYAILPENQASGFLAGIYRFEENQPVFTILTQNPAENIAHIHDRMPVLLSKNQAIQWLDMTLESSTLMSNLYKTQQPVIPNLLEGTEPMFDLPAGIAGIAEE